jgi:hypothetical protein
MREDLDVDWKDILAEATDDPDGQYTILMTKLRETQEANIPQRLNRGPRKRRLDPELKIAIKKKNRAWTRFIEARSEERRAAFNRARNKVRNLSRRLKRREESDIQ